MVKDAFLIGLGALVLTVQGQEATTTKIMNIPTDFPLAIPTAIPSEIIASISNLVNNPASIQSYVAQASAQISNLPSQYQASAYSILSKVSQSIAAAKPKNTDSHKPPTSSYAYQSFQPISLIGALVITTFIASLM
ncbi:uncharacterized protein B0P05DRAFT_530108 [Gilbertella persicaria]|uniref:uncharacterized protein n=1 Tax=Gilbertella persicaria TaxID=101096 RepID=UPI00221ECE14|nr:uncharacterized protein B0P05DRAFT_530108 [Gilbertella persicaria]KAI8090277.1 hypothetical protein B0P05DRAFT_530108 [Gilbertella persicaria]